MQLERSGERRCVSLVEGFLVKGKENPVQNENKYVVSQMQVASEKFPEVPNPWEDPQTCYLLGFCDYL